METVSTAAVRTGRAAWVARGATWLLVGQLLFSGVMMLARPPVVVSVIRRLGYPDYFPVILGVAKLLAALAIAYPRSATLTEWAYAGLTFDIVAVVASHVAMGDALGETLAPLAVLALIAVSYTAHRERREDT